MQSQKTGPARIRKQTNGNLTGLEGPEDSRWLKKQLSNLCVFFMVSELDQGMMTFHIVVALIAAQTLAQVIRIRLVSWPIIEVAFEIELVPTCA